MYTTYSNGPSLTVLAHFTCDNQTRTFSNQKTMKLCIKLHEKKCEICRNMSKTTHVYKTDIQVMKGETTKAYLDTFHKCREYV